MIWFVLIIIAVIVGAGLYVSVKYYD